MYTLLTKLAVIFLAEHPTTDAFSRSPKRAVPIEWSLVAGAQTARRAVLSRSHHLACREQADTNARYTVYQIGANTAGAAKPYMEMGQ